MKLTYEATIYRIPPAMFNDMAGRLMGLQHEDVKVAGAVLRGRRMLNITGTRTYNVHPEANIRTRIHEVTEWIMLDIEISMHDLLPGARLMKFMVERRDLDV